MGNRHRRAALCGLGNVQLLIVSCICSRQYHSHNTSHPKRRPTNTLLLIVRLCTQMLIQGNLDRQHYCQGGCPQPSLVSLGKSRCNSRMCPAVQALDAASNKPAISGSCESSLRLLPGSLEVVRNVQLPSAGSSG